MTAAGDNLDRIEWVARLTLNGSTGDDPWLPYEETWHDLATGALALVEVARAAQELLDYAGTYPPKARLTAALARLNTKERA